MKNLLNLLTICLICCNVFASVGIGLNSADTMPENFPQFIVPGHKEDMQTMRELSWTHYFWRPYSTMWDMWMPGSVLWIQSPVQQQYADGLRQTLADRHISDSGYVSTHQHRGLAHFHGWPFPLWTQVGGHGWHFSMAGIPFGKEFNVFPTTSTEGWAIEGFSSGNINDQKGLMLKIAKTRAALTTPAISVKSFIAPFIVIEWYNSNMPPAAKCFLEYKTKKEPDFSPERRVRFDPESENQNQIFTMVPIYKLPGWADREITGLRVVFENAEGADLIIQSIFTAVDSRHPINNFAFIEGCVDYVNWTGDINFLRDQINRMRLSLLYAIDEFDIEKYRCVNVPWVGHDGRSGLEYDEKGQKIIRHGRGIGNNYYDLLPFGGKECYATIYAYRALSQMAKLERIIGENPEWNIPATGLVFDPFYLSNLAKNVRQTATELFWNDETGRFVSAIDADGKAWDYGFVFLNLEAMYYDFALDWQKRRLMDWLDGKRIVDGDTSTGKDIYRWRFAPRCTTKRNLDYYVSVWSQPEILNWGDQVQDGGAVLAWSFHDIIERIKLNGPGDAWQRLQEILQWYRDVHAEGGYRAYYSKPGRGTLQGGGTAGGLGMDQEFVESLLLARIMTEGFLGIKARTDGLEISPRLAPDWPSLTASGIVFRQSELSITADSDGVITIRADKTKDRYLNLYLDYGKWEITVKSEGGKDMIPARKTPVRPDKPVKLPIDKGAVVTLTKS